MKLILTLAFTLLITYGNSQNPWKRLSELEIISKNTEERLTIPLSYHTYTLDMVQLRQLLAKAPKIKFSEISKKKAHLSLPLADGTVETFEFVESAAMSPALTAKFPMIKSFKGQSLEKAHHTAWIDYSPTGFRAAINSPQGLMYIDPYFGEADEHYIVYFVKDDTPDIDDLSRSCSVSAYEEEIKGAQINEQNKLLDPNPQTNTNKNFGMPVIKSTYRFALACTAQWSNQQGGDLIDIMSKLNSATNRLNSLFEPELAMKLELIDDNDQLIFSENNDPYIITPNPDDGSHPGRQILAQNTEVINSVVGAESYDLGHVFTVNCTDGIIGVAKSGLCTGTKGNGISCVGNSNINSYMTITTAHEIGHQFSASHTWGNCPTAEPEFSPSQNCEPGSGSTIMSYFGLCGVDDNLSIDEFVPYYHVCSLEPMYNFIRKEECGSHELMPNKIPDVWVEQKEDLYIPVSTPFELTGYASDMHNDDLLYNWEQINRESLPYPLGSPEGNAPSFRSYPPSPNNTRVFPKIENVLAGIDTREEKLPTYNRDLDFAFVARDGNLDAGGVNWAAINFKATDKAGPFIVREPSQSISVYAGGYLDIAWLVANTAQEPVNAKTVDIYLSTDGGLSFPYILLSNTPNDGSESIRLPNIISDSCKIKVKGSDHIFFNVSKNFINIEEAVEPGFFLQATETDFRFCLPDIIVTEIVASSVLGFSEDIALEIISGLPSEANYTFSDRNIEANGISTLTIDMSDVQYTGTHHVVIRGASITDTIYQSITLHATGTDLSDFGLNSPADGATGLSSIAEFEWAGSPNASSYRLEVATNPSFLENALVSSKVTASTSISNDFFNLENNTIYYWRVIAINHCVCEVASEIWTFSSKALSCQTLLAADTPINFTIPTITSEVSNITTGTISDVNVTMVKGNHSNIGTLQAKLISPSGTQVNLFQEVCLKKSELNPYCANG